MQASPVDEPTSPTFEHTGVLTEVYCGNVVFLGETENGDEADVPEDLIDLAQQLFGLQQPVS